MAGEVRINDKLLRSFTKRLRKLSKGYVTTVGVQGDAAGEAHPGGAMTMAALAELHEFGSEDGRIPERSFLRANFDKNIKRYRKMVNDGAEAAMRGRTNMGAVMFQVGETIRADTINRIREGIEPPNADVTIDRKGSSTPLIDKGHLVGSISAETKEGTASS